MALKNVEELLVCHYSLFINSLSNSGRDHPFSRRQSIPDPLEDIFPSLPRFLYHSIYSRNLNRWGFLGITGVCTIPEELAEEYALSPQYANIISLCLYSPLFRSNSPLPAVSV